MVTRTKVKLRKKRKSNPEVTETMTLALKNKAWEKVAALISGPARRYDSVNLDKIEKETKAGDTVAVVGKGLRALPRTFNTTANGCLMKLNDGSANFTQRSQ